MMAKKWQIIDDNNLKAMSQRETIIIGAKGMK